MSTSASFRAAALSVSVTTPSHTTAIHSTTSAQSAHAPDMPTVSLSSPFVLTTKSDSLMAPLLLAAQLAILMADESDFRHRVKGRAGPHFRDPTQARHCLKRRLWQPPCSFQEQEACQRDALQRALASRWDENRRCNRLPEVGIVEYATREPVQSVAGG
ncbi:uncharacterized protein BDZ99DRAFT_481408 [Mytilinidion resinicola]|uniref:Uncharacterized protein n=1 Tax=Mytilinidion resinicola TaxID=574789 RepID=A0A6A6Y632_9PEZI|nr:uncharacterized protein BDZ99DRAFT_481408 [Mytilinidion resinicola]KAF2804252.1 hypothetical protein BDZ99DRAFT_481408 [Mytilinidion resinicola]